MKDFWENFLEGFLLFTLGCVMIAFIGVAGGVVVGFLAFMFVTYPILTSLFIFGGIGFSIWYAVKGPFS